MASQKFTFTVSGVNLTEEQSSAISREIAAAVTKVLVGPSPASAKSTAPSFLTVTKIKGGLWIDPALVGQEKVADLVANAEG